MLSEDLASFLTIGDVFPRLTGPHGQPLAHTTTAGERIDAAAGLITTAEDLYRFADAYLGGELLQPETQSFVMSVAAGLETADVGTGRLGVLRAYRKDYGVLITAEGDGAGGAVSLMALHPETHTIVVAFTNIFGRFDESDYMLDVLLADVLSDRH